MGAGQLDTWNQYPDELLKLPGRVEGTWRFIKRGNVPGLLIDELHRSAWNQWCRWKRFGLPHGGGYLQEGELWVTCMEILDEEQAVYQQAKMRKGRS
jgi:hypothetical protein